MQKDELNQVHVAKFMLLLCNAQVSVQQDKSAKKSIMLSILFLLVLQNAAALALAFSRILN